MAEETSAAGERSERPNPAIAFVNESDAAYRAGLSELGAFADEDRVRREQEVLDSPQHLLRGMRLIIAAAELAYDAVEASNAAAEANLHIRSVMFDSIQVFEGAGIDAQAAKQSVAVLEQQEEELLERMFKYRGAVDKLGSYFDALGQRYWELVPTMAPSGRSISPYMGHC